MKRLLRLLRITPLVALLAMFSLAQAQTPTPQPLICDDFVGGSADVRVSYYMGEGAGYFQSGQYSAAIYSFSCIIEQIDSSYAPAYFNRAVVRAVVRDYDNARADYTRVIELNPNSAAAHNNRGIIYAAQREYELALGDFNRALQLNDDLLLGYSNRAVIHALLQDFEAAIADLNTAVERSGIASVVADLRNPERPQDAPPPVYDPRDAQPYALLGIIYSAYALSNYEDYLLLTGSQGDARIQSMAGALESRFTFDLRLDDGTWLLIASLESEG